MPSSDVMVPLDWQDMLESWAVVHGSYHDISNLPTTRTEGQLRQSAQKAEDPTTKQGIVGNFCRAFDVIEAIDHFDLPYEPVDVASDKPRYTYTGGTTTNGAVIEDGGLFLYSHHGSDPCSDRLVNSFDLVRIHKYGHLDKDWNEDGQRPSLSPSWKAMEQMVSTDPAYKRAVMEARYGDMEDALSLLPDDAAVEVEEADEDAQIEALVGEVHQPVKVNGFEHDLTAPATGMVGLTKYGSPILLKPRKMHGKPDKDWLLDLTTTQDGTIKNTVHNVTSILSHDLRFCNSIGFNEFEQKPKLIRPLVHREKHLPQFTVRDTLRGDPYGDDQLALIRTVLSTPPTDGRGWGVQSSENNMHDAIRQTAQRNRFHPVREFLESAAHDGVARAERLFIDYLNCPDTPYFRETAKLALIAGVARIFEPGHKWDYVPVLWGMQGVRKSTFIKILAVGWFGELTADFGNDQKLAEQMMGCWIMEIAELVSMAKSEVETAKQFLSQTHMNVRMAYDRHPTHLPRQTIFFGSTNTRDFLKDPTGNRRFWPIEVMTDEIDTDLLIENLQQIWAEAVVLYRQMRAECPYGDLPLFLTREAEQTAKSLQQEALRTSDAEIVAEIVDDYIKRDDPTNPYWDADLKRVTLVTYKDVSDECAAAGHKMNNLHMLIGEAMDKIGWQKRKTARGLVKISGKAYTAYEPKRETLDDYQTDGLV